MGAMLTLLALIVVFTVAMTVAVWAWSLCCCSEVFEKILITFPKRFERMDADIAALQQVVSRGTTRTTRTSAAAAKRKARGSRREVSDDSSD
jgi:hypothetical protein